MCVEFAGKRRFVKFSDVHNADKQTIESLVRSLFEIPDDHELDLAFQCPIPDSSALSVSPALCMVFSDLSTVRQNLEHSMQQPAYVA